MAIQDTVACKGHPVSLLCAVAGVARSGYYKWLKRPEAQGPSEEDWLCAKILEYYLAHKKTFGYRRMTMHINRDHKCAYNPKRIRRLMRRMGLKSVIRPKKKTYVPSTPEITAENILGRDFHADMPNQKWLTDVTEFKYGVDKKAYLSAILDLGDNSIVSFVLGHRNNNDLVFKTFNLAMQENPDASPLFHSDRGFQYTSKAFRNMLDKAGCTQSMSRVGRCLDNAPMEGFWGTLKCEMYYLSKFSTYEELEAAVEAYIHYYNNGRYQAKHKSLAPLEVRNQALAA